MTRNTVIDQIYKEQQAWDLFFQQVEAKRALKKLQALSTDFDNN